MSAHESACRVRASRVGESGCRRRRVIPAEQAREAAKVAGRESPGVGDPPATTQPRSGQMLSGSRNPRRSVLAGRNVVPSLEPGRVAAGFWAGAGLRPLGVLGPVRGGWRASDQLAA